ncbi:MAG TPA: hypothetical protein VIK75_00340 [Calditerricola sp.]
MQKAMMVRRALRRLARLSPKRIARLLAQEGIKGHPGWSHRCAIARYLSREAGCEVLVDFVDEDELVCIVDEDYNWPLQIKAPESVKEFVKLFDDGAFPELVGDPEPSPAERRWSA